MIIIVYQKYHNITIACGVEKNLPTRIRKLTRKCIYKSAFLAVNPKRNNLNVSVTLKSEIKAAHKSIHITGH